jgi:hypothetical protein
MNRFKLNLQCGHQTVVDRVSVQSSHPYDEVVCPECHHYMAVLGSERAVVSPGVDWHCDHGKIVLPGTTTDETSAEDYCVSDGQIWPLSELPLNGAYSTADDYCVVGGEIVPPETFGCGDPPPTPPPGLPPDTKPLPPAPKPPATPPKAAVAPAKAAVPHFGAAPRVVK